VPYRETDATRATRDRKRTELVEAGLAVVADRGFAGTTIQAVAHRAGVSIGSFYTYFPARSDLLAAVFRAAADAELEQVRRAAEPRPADPAGTTAARRLGRIVDTFSRRALHRRRLARALLLEPADPAVEAERVRYARSYADLFAAVVGAGVATGELPAQDLSIVGPALVGAVAEALTGPLTPVGPDLDPDAVVATILGFCLHGVGARR
jgi:AcrR family transcriptional regulator